VLPSSRRELALAWTDAAAYPLERRVVASFDGVGEPIKVLPAGRCCPAGLVATNVDFGTGLTVKARLL